MWAMPTDNERAHAVMLAVDAFLGERFRGESTIVVINALIRLAIGHAARLKATPTKTLLWLHRWIDEQADLIERMKN